jgi:hypothetical protein
MGNESKKTMNFGGKLSVSLGENIKSAKEIGCDRYKSTASTA